MASPPCWRDRLGDLDLGRRHQHLADIGLHRPLPDVHDHRQAVDIGQGFSGETGRGHPGRDHDDGILVFDHGLNRGRGKLVKRSLSYCGCQEKQLVSAPDQGLQGFGFLIWIVLNSTRLPAPCSAPRSWCSACTNWQASSIIRMTPEKPGFVVEVAGRRAPAGGETAAAEPEAPAESLGALLAAADPAKGQAGFKACAACHDVTKGGPNKVGPNLWGVVGAMHGAHAGFPIPMPWPPSRAKPWTYEALNEFLHGPGKGDPGHQDGLRRRQEGAGPGQSPGLSGHAVGQRRCPSPPRKGRKAYRNLTPAIILPVFSFAPPLAYVRHETIRLHARSAKPHDPEPPFAAETRRPFAACQDCRHPAGQRRGP